ncbi:hypothetical protein PAXINDRAFT_15682 [Paxillus involutus ATCC 200175]|uniref:Uncharacterized protein n=1 Tax=Paxillus involutus ATCC 200175 TaxID=664439 RepID=A0A0C9TUM2_PAXIN|nr:hypothetical protein PAXINDRAFT_15682 [Paxillus involutus ATCC 200175]
MAQAAHAATAVLHETHGRAETIDYLADIKNMRKVVLQVSGVHVQVRVLEPLVLVLDISAEATSAASPLRPTQIHLRLDSTRTLALQLRQIFSVGRVFGRCIYEPLGGAFIPNRNAGWHYRSRSLIWIRERVLWDPVHATSDGKPSFIAPQSSTTV